MKKNTVFLVSTVNAFNVGPPDVRCFGFFFNKKEASNAVRTNRFDIHECLYDYAVIEETSEDIHGHVVGEQWFKWNSSGKKYNPCKKPKKLFNVVNFGIG